MSFVLSTETAVEWVTGRGLAGPDPRLAATELAGIGSGQPHVVDAAAWAGDLLAAWHTGTTTATEFDEYEGFEELRLQPFHETVRAVGISMIEHPARGCWSWA